MIQNVSPLYEFIGYRPSRRALNVSEAHGVRPYPELLGSTRRALLSASQLKNQIRPVCRAKAVLDFKSEPVPGRGLLFRMKQGQVCLVAGGAQREMRTVYRAKARTSQKPCGLQSGRVFILALGHRRGPSDRCSWQGSRKCSPGRFDNLPT